VIRLRSRRLSLAARLSLLPLAATVAAAGASALALSLGAPPRLAVLSALAAGVIVGLVVASLAARPLERVGRALRDGALGLRAGDYTLRLAVDRSDELGELVASYNRIVESLARERGELRQRELILETMLERTEMATLLVNAVERVIYGNRAARRLFAGGRRVEGRPLEEVLEACPERLRGAIREGGEALLGVTVEGVDEAFHVSRRSFELNARRHVLIMVRHMTPALRRQEVGVWKRVIRVIGHELGNSLAPIRSLVRSGRKVRAGAGDPALLDGILATIDESAARLHQFVDGYARFARLPEPRREDVEIASFLEQVRGIEPFTLHGSVPRRTAAFDAAQMQQVLVNLVKNACEAGSPRESVEVEVLDVPDGGLRINIADRGRGMDGETMTKAMLPFYSSKREGGGLGLALSREIVEAHGGSLHLASRAGGGLVVSLDLPAR
jgi:nitrogen fixation/metabolism regulation signal transduction histidine kinase